MEQDFVSDFEKNSELLGKILQTSVSAITVLDTEGSIVYANEAGKDILGLVPSQIAGKSYNDPEWDITTFEGEPFPEEELPFTRVIETKKPVYKVQHAIRWPDSSRRFLSINGAPILDVQQEVKQVVFSISDITEQKEAEEELRLSERRFRDVAEASGEYIWELDTEGTYTYVSKRLGEMLDRPIEEIIGRTPFSFMTEEEARRVEGWFSRKVKNRKPFKNMEHTSLLKDGSIIWQQVSGLPIFDRNGNFAGYRGTAADITEKKESEAAVKESAERLEMAISASGLGIWDLDIETGRLTWDDSMLDIYGITRQEFTSAYDVWKRALHPDDRDKAEAALQDTMHEYKPFDVQFRIVRPDGTTRHIHAIARTYFDEDRMPERIVGINQDITERVESENTLRENEAKLSSLYELAPVAIILNRKSDGKFMEANPQLFRLTGYSEAEYKKLSYWDITPEKYAEDEQRQLEELNRRGGYGPFEKEYIRKDGSLVPVILQGVVIRTAYGEEMIWSIVQDISEQKRHERELQEAKEEAERANRAKSEFLANMSHEIRTPMNAVIGLSQLLLKTEMSRDQEDKLNKIYKSSKMLLGIINDILDFSKIESNKLELELVDFHIRELVDQLSTLFYEAMSEKDLELFFHVSPDVPDMLTGDSMRIGQVLTNLLSNAVKFTDQGSVKLFVKKTKDTEKGIRIQFEVKDTGIGMSGDQLSRLFSPFTQADTSTTRKYGGSGLGLVISKRIVEAMGGELQVESEPKKGTTFSFELELSFSEQEYSPVSREILSHRKVLVVDDHKDARSILKEMLESYDMQVELAEGGEEGIEKVQTADTEGVPFDFILMDWKMPGLNGLEASRKIKELARKGVLHQAIPSVLMVSAYNIEETGIKDEDELDFVSKPVTASSLFDTMFRVADGKTGKSRTAKSERTSAPRGNVETPLFSGLRVLLVEDNELNQEVAYNLLTDTQAQVMIAHNGVEAVSRVQEYTFDMIFMDLQMPEMDGYEATRIIRETDSDIPIIALTAAAMQEDKKKVEEAGLNDHLTKPIQLEEMYRIMRKHAPVHFHDGEKSLEAEEGLQLRKLPKDVPGFDIAAGVDVVGGDPDLYLKMLFKYRGQLNELFHKLMQQIENAPHIEEAEITAHTLKGVAANMGASPLQKAAAEAEKKIKEDRVPDNADIEALEDAFEQVSRGFTFLEKFSEENGDAAHAFEDEATDKDKDEHKSVSKAEDSVPDAEYFRAFHDRLLAAEMLYDEEIESLLDALKGIADAHQRKKLYEYIDSLMYDEAAGFLDKIVNITGERFPNS